MKFDILAQINKRIPKHTKLCFLSGMIIGLVTHFYMLTNKFTNWDDINSLSTFGSGDFIGRWFLKYIHPLGSIHSIPAVHGFLFIFFLSLSACLVLEILNIKNTTSAILVPVVMVTFPSVVSTMTFMFMAHTSGIGIFMVCFSIYLLRKYKFGWFPCSVMLICVLGIYQSYVCLAITLMLMGMIVDIINGKKFPDSVKHGVICVIILGVSVLIYMKLSHFIYPNMENETYGGVGSMGEIPIDEMPRLIGRCYKRFLEFFLWKPFAFMTKVSQVTNIITSILAVVLFAVVVKCKKIYKDILNLLLIILLCGFIPLGAAFIYFMAPEVDYSMLMLYAYALIYVFVLALLEYCTVEWGLIKNLKKWQKYICWGLIIITVSTVSVSAYTDYLVTNKAYLRTDIASERVKAYFNRVLVMAFSTEGFEEGDKITILGDFYYKDNPSSVEMDIFDSEGLRELSGVALENGLITAGARDRFIKTFLGYELAKLDWSEKEAIKESDEYKSMSVYPEDGCVKKINDVWVVKMCE